MLRVVALAAAAAVACAKGGSKALDRAQKHAQLTARRATEGGAPVASSPRGDGTKLVSTAHPRLQEAFQKTGTLELADFAAAFADVDAAAAAVPHVPAGRAAFSRLGGRSEEMTAEVCAQKMGPTTLPSGQTFQCFKPTEGYTCGASCKSPKNNQFCFTQSTGRRTANHQNAQCPSNGLDCYMFCPPGTDCVDECSSCCQRITGFTDTLPQACGTCGFWKNEPTTQGGGAIDGPYDCLTCAEGMELVVTFQDCRGICVAKAGVKRYEQLGLATLEDSQCTANINCYEGEARSSLEAMPLDGTNNCYLDDDGADDAVDDFIIVDCRLPFDNCVEAAKNAGYKITYQDDDGDDNGHGSNLFDDTDDDAFCPGLPNVGDDDAKLCQNLEKSKEFKEVCRPPFKSQRGACDDEWQIAIQCTFQELLKKYENTTCFLQCGGGGGDAAAPRAGAFVAGLVAALSAFFLA